MVFNVNDLLLEGYSCLLESLLRICDDTSQRLDFRISVLLFMKLIVLKHACNEDKIYIQGREVSSNLMLNNNS